MVEHAAIKDLAADLLVGPAPQAAVDRAFRRRRQLLPRRVRDGFVVAPAAAVVLALLLRRREGRFARALSRAALLLAFPYALAVLAVATGSRDADGFIDCWPSCTPLQDATGAVLWWGGVLLAVLAAVELAYLIARGLRPRSATDER